MAAKQIIYHDEARQAVMRGVNILANTVKITLGLSLVVSGWLMYLFARKYWGNLGGLISGLFYVYAPYRAVDVWVRGALPESLAFVFYPLILLMLDFYLETSRGFVAKVMDIH